MSRFSSALSAIGRPPFSSKTFELMRFSCGGLPAYGDATTPPMRFHVIWLRAIVLRDEPGPNTRPGRLLLMTESSTTVTLAGCLPSGEPMTRPAPSFAEIFEWRNVEPSDNSATPAPEVGVPQRMTLT